MALRDAAGSINERLKSGSPLYMVVVAVVIGVCGGYGAVGFRYLIQLLQTVFWGTPEFGVAALVERAWWVLLLVPACGGALVGLIVRYLAPEARGSGVPEVMLAVARRQGRIHPRVVLAKVAASGLTIGSGGSVGREGPVAHIGAAIGSTLGQWLRVGPQRLRTMVGCGAAAGIAGTFNAPIAGALFAVEVILGDFAVPQFSPIVIAAVTATVISRRHLGDLPAFEIPDYRLVHGEELFAYAFMGLAAGLLAVVLIRSIFWTESRFERLPLPFAARTALGGLLVGAIALWQPGVLGVGYDSINAVLTGAPGVAVLGALLVAKLAAVSLSLGSGGSGGVVAPALFLGALLGAAVGQAVGAVWPGAVAGSAGGYALVGMGAVLAAVTHAPITAIMTVFELTAEYRIVLPLMTACILATLLAQRLLAESVYTLKLVRRGIQIRGGQDITLLRDIHVIDVLQTDCARLKATDTLARVIGAAAASVSSNVYVVDDGGKLAGVVSSEELRRVLPDAPLLRDLVLAEEIAPDDFPVVRPDETLEAVLSTLQMRYRDELPVVDAQRRLLGVVRLEHVLKAAQLGPPRAVTSRTEGA